MTTGLSLKMYQAIETGEMERAMELWHQVRPFEEMRTRQ